LGYPLSLVTTKAHLFVRWEDKTDRFNIEGAGSGFSSFPDDYYRAWPMASTDREVETNRYLVSLTPPEELAVSMASRGHCLVENRRAKEGYDAYTIASRLAPRDPAYRFWRHEAALALRPPRNVRDVFTPRRAGPHAGLSPDPTRISPVVPGPIQPMPPSPWAGQRRAPGQPPGAPQPPRPEEWLDKEPERTDNPGWRGKQ